MAELSEDFLSALYQVRASELQDKIAAAQEAGGNTSLLERQLSELPQTFSRELMRKVNEPAGQAYEEGLGRLQRQISRTGGRAGVGEQGAQLALGRGADVIGENLRTLYGEGAAPRRFNRQLNVSLTPDQISKLQEMGYDPYEFMSEGTSRMGGFDLGRGFNALSGAAYERAADRARREGRDFNRQEGVQFTASAGLNPLSAEFFSGLGMFVDPRTGEDVRRPEDVLNYGLSTTDPRERFVQQAERSLYNRAANAAMRGEDEQKFLERLQLSTSRNYDQAMAGFEDILAPQGQVLGSADPYRQQLQELQGGLGSIVRGTYGMVQPAMQSGLIAPTFNQFRQQAVQATGVKDPIALQQYYQTNVAPSYQYSRAGFDPSGNFGLIESSQDQILARNMQQSAQSPAMQKIMADPERQAAYGQLQSQYQAPTAGAGKGAAQAPTQSAGKGSGKGSTNQQAQTAQSMYTGFS